MDILILNGSPAGSRLNGQIAELKSLLEKTAHAVRELTLRDMKYSPCRGCFGCWVKTPGRCIFRDDGDILCSQAIHSDMVILASPLRMGYPSALTKNALDRMIPLIHPYLEGIDNEAHHMKRYDSYPLLGLLLEKEADTDQDDMDIVHEIFRRAAINLRSAMQFVAYTDKPIEEVCNAINHS